MRNNIALLTACFATLFALAACSKDEAAVTTTSPASVHASAPDQLRPSSFTLNSINVASLARYAGDDYSQSIPVSLANEMIGSYLASVSYPSYDTALRSLTFDADTLRTYLADTSIKTLRFYLAHTPAYVASAGKGAYAGLSPATVTFVIAGLNESDEVVKNRRGEVYEHMHGCPAICGNSSSPFIQ